jgi:4-hydroxy-tetrahydrodipicolinate synthase
MPILLNDPIVVAPTPTPFTDSDNIDHDALAQNVRKWLSTPLSGFVLTTANGEETLLSEDEKVSIITTVNQARAGERFVIAGIDVASTVETLRLAERYASAGADIIRVRIPRSQSPEAVREYFTEVAAQSPVPVIVIHQTFDNGPAAPPETIGEVCGLDNVFGYITDHDVRFEGWVRPVFPAEKRFWICNGGLLAYGGLLGANGACMWLGNIAPKLCMDIMAASGQGDYRTARWLQTTASILDRQIGRFGISGSKAALSLLGYTMSGPRRPGRATDDETRQLIETTLRNARLIAE